MRGKWTIRAIGLGLCLLLLLGGVLSQLTVFADVVFPNSKPTVEIAVTGNSNSDNALLVASYNSQVEDNYAGVEAASYYNLWVNAATGSDTNDGRSPGTAFRTIQKAAEVANPSTTVHIMPGVYRETVQPKKSGTDSGPIFYQAENGPGTVFIRGSERSGSLTWTQLTSNSIGLPSGVSPNNIYYADLSSWGLEEAPRFVAQLDGDGNVIARLPLAREPDWQVTTEWKYAEFWWAADGGSTVASCDPSTNQDNDCDGPSRSTTQLTDRHNDSEPAGIQAGNLTTLGNLTGATLVALDTDEGHYMYTRKIVAHDVAAGKVTVDSKCEFDSGSGDGGLGWGSKYYVENLPSLIDSPGEWWYDTRTSRLYLWPTASGSPANINIEISRRDEGFVLNNRSYTYLDGLTLEFFNDSAIHQSQSCENCGSYHNVIRNSALLYANLGIDLGQGTDHPGNVTDGFTLDHSEIGYMDSRALYVTYWWAGGTANTFTHAGVVNTVIRNSEIHDVGFRSYADNAMGILFMYPDKLRFEGNYVHHIAQNGMALSRSAIQSTKDSDFSPEEIKTGDILIKDNIFEKACLLNSDCGEVKIQGRYPDEHVFRDVLVTGNVFRNTIGWTYISEKRGRWTGGTSSEVRGMGGFGLYVDNASGVHAYRNIAYNNATSGFHLYDLWWDGDIVYYNNIAANSLDGIRLDGYSDRGSVNTQVVNNIVVNNEGYGMLIYHNQGDYGNFLVDHNLYYNNGWRPYTSGGLRSAGSMGIYGINKFYPTVPEIQSNTSWEDHGIGDDPYFWSYNLSDHNIFDGSWPDFHITGASVNVLDQGTTSLPDSLTRLLNKFGVTDSYRGLAYDIGRFEGGFAVLPRPQIRFVYSGGSAQYTLQLDPPDWPEPITLSVTSPSPDLDIKLSSSTLVGGETVTMTITDKHTESITMPALQYTIPIKAVGGGFEDTENAFFLVGGVRVFIPAIEHGPSY